MTTECWTESSREGATNFRLKINSKAMYVKNSGNVIV
jgi:hypothetical protein